MQDYISNYEKFPVIKVKDTTSLCREGWKNIGGLIQEHVNSIEQDRSVIALECYPGILNEEVIPQLQQALDGTFYFTENYMLPEDKLAALIFPDVTNDEIFGYITRLELMDFFDSNAVQSFREEISGRQGNIFIFGPGATLLAGQYQVLVYFDMPRWEGQLRFRRNEVSNLGFKNKLAKASLQYKQAFFVDWRVCDKHKKKLMQDWDFVISTVQKNNPQIIAGKDLNAAYTQLVNQPFRVVPFFDPGPWGGQWMKKYCGLDPKEKNYAWCFDCVPEENSLLLQFNDIVFETPSVNLVFAQPKLLLGDAVEARFGAEFPIRFDFLDTIEGGNLSLQVHPTNEYIREHFGMAYTQDESYYILDAEDEACVYLGLKENISPNEMIAELENAQNNNTSFDAEKFVEKFPVKKHDHILIPAGTVHCSGKNSMVLEISATPYIFTFKLWDWGRMGLDGRPRPINIEHGKKVIDWSRITPWVTKELINVIEPIAAGGDEWEEEKTGLHEREFIETRRHWFTKKVHHYTNGSVNVLNLIEGREAIVESPSGSFDPYIVHYAETFIIPANVHDYTIMPHGESKGQKCATVKAFVRFKA